MTSDITRRPSEPENRNIHLENKFNMTVLDLPGVIFQLQDIEIPGVDIKFVEQPTPHIPIRWAGAKVNFDPQLLVTFMVDEEYQNYREIFNWIIKAGIAENYQQQKELQETKFLSARDDKDTGRVFSDINIHLLTDQNVTNKIIHVKSACPTFLSPFSLTTRTTKPSPVTVSAKFFFTSFEIKNVR